MLFHGYLIECTVEIDFFSSVCVEAVVQLSLITHVGIHAESNMLSLIRMCGGVGVGV